QKLEVYFPGQLLSAGELVEKTGQKIDSLNNQINSLSTAAETKKQNLTQELLFLQSKLTETLHAKDNQELLNQELNQTINNLQNEIKSLKNTFSTREKRFPATIIGIPIRPKNQ